jgi:hypothetical protein
MPYPNDGTLEIVSERFRPLLLAVWKALAPRVEESELQDIVSQNPELFLALPPKEPIQNELSE